jgi:cellulose synthase/poly-beta-1,6-N-acetylglucosamine synthase-like glycosyltransferase
MPSLSTLVFAGEIAFWLSTALVVYVYAGYPLLVWTLSELFGKARIATTPSEWPMMSVVIAAHNEESVIAERLENLGALDYPAHRLEILIASDGSTDRTCDIVRAMPAPNVRLLDFAQNRGKVAVLNDAMAEVRGEIVILSDANTMLAPDAAKRMAAWFSDPDVGVVCGRLVLIDQARGENADGMYWKYETFLKRCEARLGALLGANGAIYAIRKSLYPRLPQRIAVDDFVIPLLAHLQSGSRIEYDADAVAYEETPPEIRSEFARRSRIGAGGFQSLSLLWPLMNPLRGWIALAFVSHKLLRWLCPFFLLGTLTTSVFLSGTTLFGVALGAQVALYAMALAGYFWPKLGSVYRVAKLPTMFAAMNLALLTGFFRWAGRRQTGVWARTARTGV